LVSFLLLAALRDVRRPERREELDKRGHTSLASSPAPILTYAGVLLSCSPGLMRLLTGVRARSRCRPRAWPGRLPALSARLAPRAREHEHPYVEGKLIAIWS
jgi:hypothetical protein